MNILSIDWDYFIDATFDDRCTLFPDTPNEKYANWLVDTIWQGRYASQDELEKIGVNERALDMMLYILEKSKGTIKKSYVCNHHTEAYKFVTDLCEGLDTQYELYNVDFHHDIYTNIYDEVNCGNWLAKLMDEDVKKKCKFHWIGTKTSDRSRTSSKGKYLKRLTFSDVLASIGNVKFDYVFLCRSDLWSPPHLDERFNGLVEKLVRNSRCRYTEYIVRSRYTDEFKKLCEMQRNAIYEVTKKNNMIDGEALMRKSKKALEKGEKTNE